MIRSTGVGMLREAFGYIDPTPTYLISFASQSSLQLAFKTLFAPPRLLVVTVDAAKLSVTIAATHRGAEHGCTAVEISDRWTGYSGHTPAFG